MLQAGRFGKLTEQKEQKPDILITLKELIRDSHWDKRQGQEELWNYLEKSLKRDELLENKLKKLKTLGLTQTMEYRILVALKEVRE